MRPAVDRTVLSCALPSIARFSHALCRRPRSRWAVDGGALAINVISCVLPSMGQSSSAVGRMVIHAPCPRNNRHLASAARW